MSLRPDTTELADAQLSVEDCEVLHAKSGDTHAFTPLMRRHYADVLGVATRHAPAAHLGEDIASETFTFAWQHFDRFALGGDFGAWVRTIAWQLARARRNREECRQRHLDRYAGHCRTAATPAACAQARHRASGVLEALAALSPQLRELVFLCDYEGRTYKEAAIGLGRSTAWVRTTLHRTRRVVRAAYSKL
jgi:RNA polymerase sigma-70 factor (ECF subfamily)